MKIGITCYPSMGGSGIVATELGLEMAKRGHEVHFITSNMPFRMREPVPNVTFHQVDVNQYSVFQYPPYDITLSAKIADVINEYDLEILHMHYAVPHAICGILAKQISGKDVKIMTTLHGTDITVLGYDTSLQSAIRFGIEKSDVVTSVSNSLKEETYEIIQPNKEIETIYNFVQEDSFPQVYNTQLRRDYGIEDDEKVIVFVSNFRKVKRVQDVVESFYKVNKQVKSKLLLIGDGPELQVARDRIKELGIENHVLYLGKQDKVNIFYQMSDLTFLLSEKESFGLVLLEAMLTGVVPIGSNAGGIKEVIKDGVTGYTVEVGDTDMASERAIALLTNPKLYKEMQTAMIKDVKQRFSSQVVADQYEASYQQMLGE
ncbi:N-acetyl-alpha-D-glucosaminyl L-malate synthase BshA [Mammaliicoccus stepanovicii]|uniref:Putative glycosyltransferase n=1 Tax=Mammaliicoccus stepanovicii TaxID=643214 RepID=A0A239Z9P9_9STAP|nr:N-acetyl-alpha-D-glucosaminyl L-malate synthase BshA [Mammaliicoccus stepanovicii]PNZ72659.1 N-acetyl-alpha-D-glucosaminyl L-malate synthase BshA [Mammaliicoccus stepanovicii]GGI39828.1 N-acetyl-alpha-D-glucosaminyl L-malate synthase BshA [Mammaliicoccus stepanovicii]SNV67607.1 putative glycosyltransferase [Mammaliicoccus stepanovicii]